MNGVSKKMILLAISIVASAGVLGATFAKENAAQVLGFCSLICVSLLGLLQSIYTAEKLTIAAAKVEEVKVAAVVAANKIETALVVTDAKTETALGDLKAVVGSTHKLVNSAMTKQLEISAVALRRLADLTKNTADGKGDEKAAVLAEAAFTDHEASQAIVDQGKAIAVKPDPQ